MCMYTLWSIAMLFIIMATLVIPVVISIFGIKWFRSLLDKDMAKLSKRIILVSTMIPAVLVYTFAIYIVVVETRDYLLMNRTIRYTVHTHILSVELDRYTMPQRRFLNPPFGESGTNYSLLIMRRVVIDDEHLQQEFERVFDAELPEINFRQYYFLVLPGQHYDGWRGALRTRRIDPYIVNVYQVNIVR